MSTLKVTNLQKLDGTTFPVGKVGQVVQSSHSTAVTLNTSSFVDTGLTASITPTSTTSKILVSVVQSIYLDGGGAGITLRVVRDSTTVFTQPVNYARYQPSSSNDRIFYPIEYLDSPSSTSAIAYKTQGYVLSILEKFNMIVLQAMITLMEVLA